ncbi:MAG TPA: hypothetical protein VKF17_11935 [Isosphaeraceae bacterium]|nr:hypothetical protein [Isosphaeraceae bacterium]
MRREILRSWTGSRVPKRRFQPTLNPVESRLLLSTFTVTTTADSDVGSLRQAIYMADNAGGTNTIDFDIPGSGPQVITLQSKLPPITSPTIIDGYTQPGSNPNTSATADNAVPLIVIDGSQITNIAQSVGLQLQADDSTVEGLVIENFGGIGVVLSGANDVVQGDFIGTNPYGMTAQPNTLGVGVIGSGDVIGGTSPASRDLVSGNDIGVGIASLAIGGPSLLTAEAGSTVQGDLIGTNATGTGNLGNSVIGVALAGSGNIVGGTSAGQANTIAFNGEAGSALNIGVGVVVIGLSPSALDDPFVASLPISVQSTGNLISGNSIHDNHNMGIGLLDIPTSSVLPFLTTSTASIPSAVANFLSTVDLGVVPNAQTPSGTGPNNLQNFPVIGSAVTEGGATTVQGTLQSTPNTAYHVQVFSDPTPGASGYGEGQVYLGQTSVTTGANGLATFAFTSSTAVPVGQVIAATAIDPSGNTSEFSKAVTVTSTVTTAPLQVQSIQRIANGKHPTSIVLTFGQALNPTSAENLANYSLYLVKNRPHNRPPKETLVKIKSAVYDPTTMTVTLTTKTKLNKIGEYSLTVSGTGVTSLNGSPLAGSNGVPGTNYTTIVGPPINA